MNPLTDRAGDILRGMELEALPLRLGRRNSPAMQPGAPARDEDAMARERQQQAQREAREQAARAGYEEGLRRGLTDAEARARPALEQAKAQALAPLEDERRRLVALVAALEQARAECLLAAEEDAVALCYQLLCRTLGAGAPNPEDLRAQWLDLCAGTAAEEGPVLHVHPQDAARLASSTAQAGARSEPAGRVRWIADPQVALGGCIVRSAAGGLDARLETMLAACKTGLLAARAARAGGSA